MGFRSERAVLASGQVVWTVVGADDFVLHHEGSVFLQGLRDAGRAYNTERTYAGRVALFLSYCQVERINWRSPTIWQLSRFLHWLVEMPIPPKGPSSRRERFRDTNTANAIMTTVCEYLKFGIRRGWVPRELEDQLAEPKFLAYLPKDFNPGEEGQFRTVRAKQIKFASVDSGIEWLTIDQISRLAAAARHRRDLFLVLLLWCTGMRIGEALGLRREDLHFMAESQWLGCQVKGPHVHVRRRINGNGAWAKSRMPRTIPVTADLVADYTDYLHERSAVAEAEVSDMVFVNLFRAPLGRGMSYSSAKDLFDRLARRAGLRARPHMIRHGAATHWIKTGTDEAVVQELLGHVSKSSMSVYVHASDEDKRAAVERVAARQREAVR